jgi:hypothetical protein
LKDKKKTIIKSQDLLSIQLVTSIFNFLCFSFYIYANDPAGQLPDLRANFLCIVILFYSLLSNIIARKNIGKISLKAKTKLVEICIFINLILILLSANQFCFFVVILMRSNSYIPLICKLFMIGIVLCLFFFLKKMKDINELSTKGFVIIIVLLLMAIYINVKFLIPEVFNARYFYTYDWGPGWTNNEINYTK